MAEIFFVPNPDESSPVGLLEVPIEGEEPTHHNTEYADLIRRAIEISRIEDPQALVMEALYRGNGIPRALVDEVEPTVQEIDVGWSVRDRLYELEEEQPGSVCLDTQVLGEVLETGLRNDIGYLTRDGLYVDIGSGDFTVPLLQDAIEPLGLAEEEREVAMELGATVYAFQAELVWRPDAKGSVRPILRSRRDHTALGRVAGNGTFEYIGAVLNRDHPVRVASD
jgi:GNAT superfamily N-acetyltransferase